MDKTAGAVELAVKRKREATEGQWSVSGGPNDFNRMDWVVPSDAMHIHVRLHHCLQMRDLDVSPGSRAASADTGLSGYPAPAPHRAIGREDAEANMDWTRERHVKGRGTGT